MNEERVVVRHFPLASSNPYQQLMFKGLAVHGVDASGIENGIRGLVREAFSGEFDVLHLHWIHRAATYNRPLGAFVRLCGFHAALLVAGFRGKHIVWTVHNLINHEGMRNRLDRWNAMLVAREADAVLVHGETVISIVAGKLGVRKEKIRSIRHGNYAGVVSPQAPRERGAGIRLLFFGVIRPYKGVEDLLKAFHGISGSHRLHIAGMPRDKALQHAIEEHSSQDPERVTAELEFVSDDRLEELFAWCDAVVLPYRDIFTSGSVLMAMTAGRPVIAPRAGLIPEYIDERAGFLYDLTDPHGLEQALAEATRCTRLAEMAWRAAERAEEFDWALIGGDLATIYNELNDGNGI